jgi:hypothetical protein
MTEIRVIGDTVHLNGIPVADIRPSANASERYDLVRNIEMGAGNRSMIEPGGLHQSAFSQPTPSSHHAGGPRS